MHTKIFKKFTSLAVSLILAFSFVSCQSSVSKNVSAGAADNTVKIAYLPITHALPVLEEAEKIEEKTGLKVDLVKYGSWPELMDALNTGRVDGASVLIELAMKARELGVDVKAVALGHKDGNALVVKEGINSSEDLKGKTIAIPHRLSSHNILLNDALAKGGLTINDVNVVELSPAEMPATLSAGQIDGYCVAEPFGAKAVEMNIGHVLYQSEDLWENSICCAFVLTGKFINERPEAAKEVVEEYKESGEHLSGDKEEEMKVAQKYFKAKPKVLDRSFEWISYDDLDITEEAYNDLRERMIKYHVSDNPPEYKDFVKNDF